MKLNTALPKFAVRTKMPYKDMTYSEMLEAEHDTSHSTDDVIESEDPQHFPDGTTNPAWLESRKGLITGTLMSEICDGPFFPYGKTETYIEFVKRIYEKTWKNFCNPKPIVPDDRSVWTEEHHKTHANLTRGTLNEHKGIEAFVTLFGSENVRNPGLAINRSQLLFIADSADGVVHRPDSNFHHSIEIKCPNKLPANPSNMYMFQCQSHMAIHDTAQCTFITYVENEGVRFWDVVRDRTRWSWMCDRALFFWAMWYGASDLAQEHKERLYSHPLLTRASENPKKELDRYLEMFVSRRKLFGMPETWELAAPNFVNEWMTFFPDESIIYKPPGLAYNYLGSFTN